MLFLDLVKYNDHTAKAAKKRMPKLYFHDTFYIIIKTDAHKINEDARVIVGMANLISYTISDIAL